MAYAPNGQADQISSYNFLNPFGIYMPQIRPQLVQYQNKDYFLQDILEDLQQTEPIRGTTWTTYVEPMIEQTLIATAAANAGAADAAVDIVVDDSPGITGGLYARDRFIIKNARTGQNMTIVETDIATLTITVLPKTGTNILATNAGDEFIVIGSSNVEGAKRVQSLTGIPTSLDFNVQIFEEAALATSFSIQDMVWFDVPEADQQAFGLPARCWYSFSLYTAMLNFRAQHNKTLLVGEADELDVSAYSSAYGTNASPVMFQTAGLHSQVRANGNIQPNVNSLGSFQLLENTLIANHGDYENWVLHGNKWRQGNDNWLLDLFKNGAVNYGSFNGNKEIAIKIGFQSLEMGNFTWHFKPLKMYDDPQGLGAGSNRYSGGALVLPTGAVKVYSGADGTNSSMAKPLRYRYKALYKGAITQIAFTYGRSYSDLPNEVDDVQGCTYTSVGGFELLAAWKAVEIPGV